MSILVLGGAGYVGSHAVYQLIDQGFSVAVIDNLQTGHSDAIHPKASFYEGDIRSREFMRSVFEKENIRSGDVPKATAEGNEPAHMVGLPARRLERDLAANRVPDQDRGRVTGRVPHEREVRRVCADPDAIVVHRRAAPPVASVVPVGQRDGRREILP